MSFTGTHPTTDEVERIRLLLSTYQDGTGQFTTEKHTTTLPNWRDFERAVAVAMNGKAQESKSFYDVIISGRGETFGISCKMRAELKSVRNKKKRIIYVEVSNAAGDFWGAVRSVGIDSGQDMGKRPEIAGKAILDLVKSWHHQPGIDLPKSYYLVCQYNVKPLEYQLFLLDLDLPDPSTLDWRVRVGKKKNGTPTHCLIGEIGKKAIIEWYADSGGQLKYYPSVDEAIWQSDVFTLETLPDTDEGYSIMNKAKAYFPERWKSVEF